MIRFKIASIFILFSVCNAALALPVTIDFDSAPLIIGPGYTEDGFSVSTTANGGNGIGVSDGACGPPCPANGTIAYQLFNTGNPVVTITAVGGGPFSISSFDVGESHIGLPVQAHLLTIVGNLFGGGIVNSLFNLDLINDGPGGVADFETVALVGFNDLTSLTITGSGPNGRDDFALDNIVVSAAAVPEPASVFLFGLGLAGFGFARRKRV